MVVVAPRSAKLVEARGARFTLLLGYVFCVLGFLTMLLLWKEDIAYWKVGLGYAFIGIGVGFAGTPASHSLTGSVPVRRAGMASGTADLQRDLGGAIMQSIFGALLTAGYAAAASAAIAASGESAKVSENVEGELTKSFSSAADLAAQYPRHAEQIIAAAKASFLQGDAWAYTRRDRRDPARRRARLLPLPEAATRRRRCWSATTPKMPERGPARSAPTLREEERVTPLELFFDLVFVLAITQCTALMSHHPTWSGLAQGLLVLGMLWWAWVGYAWLTSVLDPEEGAVRLVMFGAMAALLIVSLCVPEAFGEPGARLRPRLRRGAGRPHRPLHARQPRGRRAAPLGARARRQHRGRDRPARRRLPVRRRSPRARSGRSPSSSTWPAPTSSAPRAGS